MGLEFGKWRPYKVRSLVSNSIYSKKDRNGPPSANQVASKDVPRRGHAVCTNGPPMPTKSLLKTCPHTAMLFAPFGCTYPPPPVPPFLLMQNLSPKDIRGSDIMKLSFMTDISAEGPKEFQGLT